jgi:hypothetical protein
MRRSIHALVAAAAVLAAAACGDNAVSPTANAKQQAPTAADFSFTAGSLSRLTGSGYDFVVTPAGGTVNVGGLFSVTFPANAVCDPSTSSYGPGTWDDACTPVTGAIHEHAEISATSKGVRVDFSTPLRFVPSQTVTISTNAFAGLLTSASSYFAQNLGSFAFLTIQYDPSLTATGVDDAASDASLATHVDLNSGTLSRRIKHFSGYGVALGDGVCDPNTQDDPDCQSGPTQGGGGAQ